MSHRKNRKILILSFIIGMIVFGVCRSDCVKLAISPWKAKMLCDNSEYFIVGIFIDYGNGGYYYTKGAEKVPVYVTGKSPAYELAPPISGEDANNKYLIRGYIDWELSKIAGKEVLVVEEWEIIAPIHRSYDIEDPNKRFFSPLLYLDKYDMDTRAYYKIIHNIRALEWYEVDRILEENTETSYIVTSEYDEGVLQWYIVQTEDVKVKETFVPIDIKGCDISEHLGAEILENRYNKFLICGEYLQNKNVIYADEWYIIAPILGKSNYTHQFNYSSRYYFEQQDINLGIYIP